MHIPKKAIEKAREGWWENHWGSPYVEINKNLFAKEVYAWIALDPSFWQALGKALDWDPTTGYFSDFQSSKYNQIGIYAHRFYDLILTGQDTTSFWNELLGPTLTEGNEI